MPHEILKLGPMPFIFYPKPFIHRFQYLIRLFFIGSSIFPYLFSQHSGQFISTIVIRWRMSYSSTVIIKCITGPNTAISIIQPVIIRVIIQFFPCQMTSQYKPHFTYIVQIAGPVEMPEQLINVAKIHIIMMHLILSVRSTANIPVTVMRGTPFFYRTCQM